MIEFNQYVGLPFRDKGRDRDGLDCWGLLRLVYAEQAGVDLPSYAEDYATAADTRALADMIAGRLLPWREVSEEAVKPLDGLLMCHGGMERHIGVVVRRGLVLHIGLEIPTSRIEHYGSLRLKRRVSRFLRHEALA